MAQQRVVLVTGGMGGLGETICTKMADAGYKVAATYSPGNKTHGEWVAGLAGSELRSLRQLNARACVCSRSPSAETQHGDPATRSPRVSCLYTHITASEYLARPAGTGDGLLQ